MTQILSQGLQAPEAALPEPESREEEAATSAAQMRERTAAFNKQLRANPQNVRLWQDYIAYQVCLSSAEGRVCNGGFSLSVKPGKNSTEDGHDGRC